LRWTDDDRNGCHDGIVARRIGDGQPVIAERQCVRQPDAFKPRCGRVRIRRGYIRGALAGVVNAGFKRQLPMERGGRQRWRNGDIEIRTRRSGTNDPHRNGCTVPGFPTRRARIRGNAHGGQ